MRVGDVLDEAVAVRLSRDGESKAPEVRERLKRRLQNVIGEVADSMQIDEVAAQRWVGATSPNPDLDRIDTKDSGIQKMIKDRDALVEAINASRGKPVVGEPAPKPKDPSRPAYTPPAYLRIGQNRRNRGGTFHHADLISATSGKAAHTIGADDDSDKAPVKPKPPAPKPPAPPKPSTPARPPAPPVAPEPAPAPKEAKKEPVIDLADFTFARPVPVKATMTKPWVVKIKTEAQPKTASSSRKPAEPKKPKPPVSAKEAPAAGDAIKPDEKKHSHLDAYNALWRRIHAIALESGFKDFTWTLTNETPTDTLLKLNHDVFRARCASMRSLVDICDLVPSTSSSDPAQEIKAIIDALETVHKQIAAKRDMQAASRTG